MPKVLKSYSSNTNTCTVCFPEITKGTPKCWPGPQKVLAWGPRDPRIKGSRESPVLAWLCLGKLHVACDSMEFWSLRRTIAASGHHPHVRARKRRAATHCRDSDLSGPPTHRLDMSAPSHDRCWDTWRVTSCDPDAPCSLQPPPGCPRILWL